jgi:uncharacterized protein YegP (UPF0339 family)
MAGKFWICRGGGDDRRLRWTFIAPNGRTVVDSADTFATEADAVASVARFRERAPGAPVVAPDGDRIPYAFLLHVCPRGYCWEVSGADARTLAWSFLPYDTLKAAFKGIAIVRRLAGDAYLVRPGDPRQPTTAPRAVRARPAGEVTLTDPERVREWVRRANAELLALRAG